MEDVKFDLADAIVFIERHRKVGKQPRVALQFPDCFLPQAVSTADTLRARCDCAPFILADTTFGSCCVDEVAAQHAEADMIVHFGDSCLSPTKRLPVHHVFNQRTCELDDVLNAVCVSEASAKDTYEQCILVFELPLIHYMSAARATLSVRSATSSARCAVQVALPRHLSDAQASHVDCTTSHLSSDGRKIPLGAYYYNLPASVDPNRCSVVFIGAASTALSNVALNLHGAALYTFDPSKAASLPARIPQSKTLARRFFLMNKARDAEIIGIVVGTLGVGMSSRMCCISPMT